MASGIAMGEACPCGSGDLYRDCCGRAIVLRARQRRNAALVVLAIAAAAIPAVIYMNRLDDEKLDALTMPEGAYYSEEHKHWHDESDQELEVPGFVWSPIQLRWIKVNETMIEEALAEKSVEESLHGDAGGPIEERFSDLPEAQSGIPAPEGPAPAGQVWSERHGHFHDPEDE